MIFIFLINMYTCYPHEQIINSLCTNPSPHQNMNNYSYRTMIMLLLSFPGPLVCTYTDRCLCLVFMSVTYWTSPPVYEKLFSYCPS